MKENKVSGSMLSGIKAAEEVLARRESENLGDGLPEGHPLLEELAKQQSLLGDLSGLPPGHPLVQTLLDAKERYQAQESEIAEETETAQQKTKKLRQAKRIEHDKAERQRRAKEDEQKTRVRTAAHDVNERIDDALEHFKGLYKQLTSDEEILNINPYCKTRVERLKRLLFAIERGLSSCKMGRV